STSGTTPSISRRLRLAAPLALGGGERGIGALDRFLDRHTGLQGLRSLLLASGYGLGGVLAGGQGGLVANPRTKNVAASMEPATVPANHRRLTAWTLCPAAPGTAFRSSSKSGGFRHGIDLTPSRGRDKFRRWFPVTLGHMGHVFPISAYRRVRAR